MEWELKLTELEARQRTSEHRIKDLENDLRDLRDLTNAVAVTNESVRQLRQRVEELHGDIRRLTNMPAKRYDTIITASITAVAGALVGALWM